MPQAKRALLEAICSCSKLEAVTVTASCVLEGIREDRWPALKKLSLTTAYVSQPFFWMNPQFYWNNQTDELLGQDLFSSDAHGGLHILNHGTHDVIVSLTGCPVAKFPLRELELRVAVTAGDLDTLRKLHKFPQLEKLTIKVVDWPMPTYLWIDVLETLAAELRYLPALTDLSVTAHWLNREVNRDAPMRLEHIEWRLPALRKLTISCIAVPTLVAPNLEEVVAPAATVPHALPLLKQASNMRKLWLPAFNSGELSDLASLLASDAWTALTDISISFSGCQLAILRALAKRPRSLAALKSVLLDVAQGDWKECTTVNGAEVCAAIRDVLSAHTSLEHFAFGLPSPNFNRVAGSLFAYNTPAGKAIVLPHLRQLELDVADDNLFRSIECPNLVSLYMRSAYVSPWSPSCPLVRPCARSAWSTCSFLTAASHSPIASPHWPCAVNSASGQTRAGTLSLSFPVFPCSHGSPYRISSCRSLPKPWQALRAAVVSES